MGTGGLLPALICDGSWASGQFAGGCDPLQPGLNRTTARVGALYRLCSRESLWVSQRP